MNVAIPTYHPTCFPRQAIHTTIGQMVELGMVGVVATQLWYHTFIDSSLADIPGGWNRPQRVNS